MRCGEPGHRAPVEIHAPAGRVAVSLDGITHTNVIMPSAEALKAFVDSRLMPAMQKLRIPPPTVSVYPSFNINAFQAVEKLVLR